MSREGMGVSSSIKGVTYSHRQSLGNSKATGLIDTGLVSGLPSTSLSVLCTVLESITYASR